MSDSWKQATLGSISTFRAGDAFGKDEQGRSCGDHPFIKVSDMNLPGNEVYIRRANNWVSDIEARSRYTLHPADAVVFAKIGVALTYNRRRRLIRPTIIDNNMMSAICREVDPVWYYYLLNTIDFNEVASGSALPYLTVKALSQLPIVIPTPGEQQAIGATLQSLDDKIDLNRRMNETLEQMARAIFKDWFVDFGPTRAKIEGREPYLAPDLWALFPDRLDEDGKPEGWEFGHLDDIAESPRRGISPADVSESTPYIGLEHMPRRSISLPEWEVAGKVTSNKSVFRAGEFLFGKLRPYFHKVGVAPLEGICSTDIVVVAPKETHWSAYVLACISTDDFVAFTDQTSTGTKMPRTSWAIMGRYELCLPTETAASAYQAIAQPMIERIIGNIHESRTLAETRNLLLPKLMSGEIQVREAEKMVENVA